MPKKLIESEPNEATEALLIWKLSMQRDIERYRAMGTWIRPCSDIDEGERLAREGMDKAWAAEAEAWKCLAWETLVCLANTGQQFNADDIREKIGEPTRPNAMGSLFSKAKRQGLIHIVGFRPMRNKSAHARVTFVYSGKEEVTDGK